MYSRQCILRNGRAFTVAYLPERLAKEGNQLQSKDRGAWVVEKVATKSAKDQPTFSQEYGDIWGRT